jgi:hypothetical protein
MRQALQKIAESAQDPLIAKIAREGLPKQRQARKPRYCKYCGGPLPKYDRYQYGRYSQFCSHDCFTQSHNSSPYLIAKRKARDARAEQVKQLRSQGMTYKDIGAKFGISGATLPRFPRGQI